VIRDGDVMRSLGLFHPGTAPGRPAPEAKDAPSGFDVASGWHAARVVDPQREQTLRQSLLLLLMVARLVMVVTGLGLLVAYGSTSSVAVPWLKVAFVAACIAGLTAPVYRRKRLNEPMSESYIAMQLLADVALLGFAFYQTGGIDNPFLVFLAVPVTLAAYALSPARVVIVVGAVAVVLLFLGRFHNEVGAFDELAHEVSELIAVAMLGYFAFMVARLSRNHEREVARARESALRLRGRQALKTVAVQAADAISSPLATMSILAHDMRHGRMAPAEREASLEQLEQQIDLCKHNLSALLESVGQPRGSTGQVSDIAEVLRSAAAECELMDPHLTVVFERPLVAPPPIVDERSLFDAFVLMIQHCAAGTPRAVRIDARWNVTEIRITMCSAARPDDTEDGGAGGSVELAAMLVGRFGGTVSAQAREGGQCLRVRIPIAPIGVAEQGPVPAKSLEVAHGGE